MGWVGSDLVGEKSESSKEVRKRKIKFFLKKKKGTEKDKYK